MSRHFYAALLYLINLFSRRTKSAINNKPVLTYKGVDIYYSYKGSRPLFYSYALTANHQAELDSQFFDVRALPEKYKTGLTIEDQSSELDLESIGAKLKAEHGAHKEAIRRAIDDNYDFLAAMKSPR
jgi:hypothetical protein